MIFFLFFHYKSVFYGKKMAFQQSGDKTSLDTFLSLTKPVKLGSGVSSECGTGVIADEGWGN